MAAGGLPNSQLHKFTVVETTTPLAANATFTGAWHDTQVDGAVFSMVTIFANQVSASAGVNIQESDDITNANFTKSINAFTLAANTLTRLIQTIKSRYWRIVFTNGPTAQTSFEITSCVSDVINYPNSLTDFNTSGDTTPLTFVVLPGTFASIGDNNTSSNYVGLFDQSGEGPTEAFVPVYGGAFSGTPNAALQGWSRPRTPTVFKIVSATAAGSTAVWTPGSGNKFRLLAWRIVISQTTTLAAAGDEVIKLLDSATDIAQDITVRIAAAAGTSGALYDSGWQQLGQFGILSAAANNPLNVNLGTSCATGAVQVLVAGTEE